MGKQIADTVDLYFNAYDPDTSVRVVGKTPVGCETNSGLPAFISADSQEDLLRKCDGMDFSSWTPLPALGEEVLADEIYSFNGSLVVCRQTHTRTADDPAVIPALFLTYQEDTGNPLGWIGGEWVAVDTKRVHEGITYIAIQAHQTLEGWEPPNVPALWQVVTSGVPDWVQPTGAQDAYNIGDHVMFNGVEYESVINANVWSPAVYPAGWAVVV